MENNQISERVNRYLIQSWSDKACDKALKRKDTKNFVKISLITFFRKRNGMGGEGVLGGDEGKGGDTIVQRSSS